MKVITHSKHAVNLSATERWASVMVGGALASWGLTRRSRAGWALAAVGGDLVRRGATGHSYLYEALGVRTAPLGQGAATTSVPYELGIRVDHSITVERPRAEVFGFWRNFENLPQFMKHIQSVRLLDEQRSHWVARAPLGRTVEWEATIHNESENERIAWRSLEGSEVDHAGSVWFRDAPGGRGTVVTVELQYNPPGGMLGAMAAKMWGEEPTQQIREDLRRFKQIMEAGEVPTVDGQPQGGEESRFERQRMRRGRAPDVVSHASEQSFPASDAPSWT